MIIDAGFLNQWEHKGHRYGECMSHKDSPLMYVYIPKNASSWTKPNLKDFGWEFYNYHDNKLNKLALVVLRDPIDRWVSGIAEYLTLYHSAIDMYNKHVIEIIFDQLTFDDHTESQVKFIHGLDTKKCIFFMCNDTYRANFSKFMKERYGSDNKYSTYDYQHVSANSADRNKFKNHFSQLLQKNPQYLKQLEQHFAADYKLMEQIKFYDAR